MDSELARFVGGGGDYAALVALAADYDCLAFKRGVEEFFHGYEEGVHIDVEDGAGEGGLVGGSHAVRILAAALAMVRSAQSGALTWHRC